MPAPTLTLTLTLTLDEATPAASCDQPDHSTVSVAAVATTVSVAVVQRVVAEAAIPQKCYYSLEEEAAAMLEGGQAQAAMMMRPGLGLGLWLAVAVVRLRQKTLGATLQKSSGGPGWDG